ncbi:NAD(P)-binding protein [Aspergillus steynii IBT 23096]|uniref:NAD(P)-binding protein n=1 Tax=Aspergillus steynii IBT 23096 TaxID=1392250 RepID=A0A2I2G3Z5_9EURO|nr:NAD(P)-binding protein [Aspergillus steynii IBT 23096]PLB47604.1 NAD(P)-binding protein [Aspergillus steynii IBT 23096]
MAIIAVAGGTGSVGQAIVDALTATKHSVIVLTRTPRPNTADITYLAVNYDDVPSTSAALESANIDTVICAISMLSEESSAVQHKLISACASSTPTRRFVVSSFDIYFNEQHISTVPAAKWQYDALDALAKTDLEYTRVVNGFFLDYYGMPHWKTHLKPWTNSVSVAGKWAVIPGDGTSKGNFITSQDLGRFVARMMDLPRWNKLTTIVGEELTFLQIVEAAERVRGEKFRVIYESMENLADGKISFPEFPEADYGLSTEQWEKALAGIHHLAGMNVALVPTDDPLNKHFPDLKLTTVSEVIESWRGK